MISKEEAKERVRVLVNKFSNYSKERLDSMPEEDIKFQFIEPLLEILGWERESISKETRVLKTRADYILKIGNQESLVVEAKKTNVGLSEDEGRQAVSYAYHRKIKFSVLTNFKYLRVFHALSNIKNIDRNLLFWIGFEDFEKEFDKLWLISRESIEKEEINKLYLSKKDEKQYVPVDESILEDLLEIRRILSNDLKKLRNYLTDEQIDESIQILIDRLIFIRSAEDRGLENKNFLLGLVKESREGRLKVKLWYAVRDYFKEFDENYNSKLFAPGILEDEKNVFIDEDTLTKVIRILYYGIENQQSRYMFDEIPGDLLGSIYEQYLGVVLRGSDKRVRLETETGKRKKMGIYYTPSYIVDYIVKNTVGEYIKDKTIDEILDVNIVDPACGSGSFLTRAFQEVCDIVEKKLKEGEKAKHPTFKNYNDKLNLAQKSTILSRCIYGVDLDEKAVELAQLNLLLKILEDEERTTRKHILPNLKSNIKNGNSLIDDSKIAGDKAFNWNAQFPEEFRRGGFDIVIGNPPYVDIKQLESSLVKFLFSRYKTTENRMNLYSTFVEKTFNILGKFGEFGFIIPNSILYNSSYNKLRRLLLENVSLKKIVRLPDNVFGEAKVETIILIYKKGHNKDNVCEILIYERNDKINEIRKELSSVHYGSQKDWEENFTINLSMNKISHDLISKIELKSNKLVDICDFSLGLTPYDKYKGHTKKQIEERAFHSEKRKDNTFKPLLSGANIVRYGIFWDSKEYISYGKWLGAPREERFFREPRIVVRQILSGNPLRIYAGYVEEELYNTQIGFNLVCKDKIKLKYILAILNSKLINFYHREKYIDKEKNLFQKILIANAKNFPIKIVSNKEEKEIANAVDEILSLKKKLYASKEGNEKERLEQQVTNKDYEIDQEVYKLYNITEEEQKIIEESLK